LQTWLLISRIESPVHFREYVLPYRIRWHEVAVATLWSAYYHCKQQFGLAREDVQQTLMQLPLHFYFWALQPGPDAVEISIGR
jgi:hypothetical protein